MTTSSLATVWVQLLALLAVEVGLVTLLAALLRRWRPSAVWQRTSCQAGIAAVLLVTACELSGSARWVAGWATAVTRPAKAGTVALSPIERPTVPQNDSPAVEATVSLPSIRQGPVPVKLPAVEVAPTQGQFMNGVGTARPQKMPAWGAGSAGDEPAPPRCLRAREMALVPTSDVGPDSLWVLGIGLVWGIGALLATVRLCLSQCLFVLFRLRRRALADPGLIRRVERLALTLGISRRVRVIESPRLTTPIAFGVLVPTVGLPLNFATGFNHAKQEAMLAHELAHLAAHDPFWCLLVDLAAILLWWHPGVWWLRRQLHLASEMAADEASLLVADGPQALAECLVELGSRLTHPVLPGYLRVSGFRSHLGRRVQRLVQLEGGVWSSPPRLRAAFVRIFGPMAMVAVVVLCTAWAAPQALTTGDSMKTMQLNWKRALATFTLLAAVNSPEAPVTAAQSNDSAAAPAGAATNSAPAEAKAPVVAPPPGAPVPPGLPPDAANAFRNRYGLSGPPTVGGEVPPPPGYPGGDAEAAEAFRRRYGLPNRPVRSPASAQPEKSKRGVELEAKLKKIILPECAFSGLPLNEALRVLSDQSQRLDEAKTGVNFLINPNLLAPITFGGIDPATGQPPVVQPFDASAVIVTFSLPLRNVSMKDILDAIVMVADHPIQYTIEDYAVVFAGRPRDVSLQTHLQSLRRPGQGQPPTFQSALRPLRADEDRPAAKAAQILEDEANPALEDVKPQTFDVDFGAGAPSKQVGPAAAGQPGDFWNTVSVGFNSHHTESGLKFAGGDASPIKVEMINLGGGWGCSGKLGVKSPMLDSFNYPVNNQGGNSTVILHRVPPGKYAVYIYGHGTEPLYYGDYTLSVGTRTYGRKNTFHEGDRGLKTRWAEGYQYVKFTGVKVAAGEKMEILIQPGGQVTDPLGRTFADAMIAGLQLIPAK
jgi:beta-lactamase regulating signal transducer with metallopeptidase domain